MTTGKYFNNFNFPIMDIKKENHVLTATFLVIFYS